MKPRREDMGFRILGEDAFELDITERLRLGAVGGVSDKTAPAVTITSAFNTITVGNPTVTFTFSEDVIGFELGDITVGNGAAGTFVAISASVYTAIITPTAAGTVTVDVGAGVCQDVAGNPNEAAAQWSILSIKGATLWQDYSDLTTLYQANNTTTPVTSDGQTIGYVTDKSGAGNHATQATEGNRPLYKANIQNSKGAGLWQGSGDLLSMTGLAYDTAGVSIFIACKPAVSDNYGTLLGTAGSNGTYWRLSPTTPKILWYNVAASNTQLVANTAYLLEFLASANVLSYYYNGTVDGTPALTQTGNFTGIGSGSAGSLTGYIFEIIVFPTALAAPARQAIENYLNTKWQVFF